MEIRSCPWVSPFSQFLSPLSPGLIGRCIQQILPIQLLCRERECLGISPVQVGQAPACLPGTPAHIGTTKQRPRHARYLAAVRIRLGQPAPVAPTRPDSGPVWRSSAQFPSVTCRSSFCRQVHPENALRHACLQFVTLGFRKFPVACEVGVIHGIRNQRNGRQGTERQTRGDLHRGGPRNLR